LGGAGEMSAEPGILALHGNLGSPEDWMGLGLPGLRAVDLWDHAGLGFSEFAEALAGPLAEGMERPLLAGYSLGGRLALHALALFPERWSGAVVVAAHPGLCCVEDRIARRSSDAVWAERARSLPWAEFLEGWNAQALFGGPPGEGLLARQRVLEARREAVATAFGGWSLAGQGDLRGSLRAFAGPVLWAAGERDSRYVRIAAEMAGVFPDCRLFVAPDCAHRVLEESPAALAGAVRDLFGLG
jgi:2-succinyl-6-hydroxy-2,4-cyclohexadiene-1-carboxylate synthase